ncbi:hypothetical protein DFH27DRAFT_599054 [Peziza echinospora]|nr:hypothetical protein DFH27DRAFT_599054 [Peziza echinospora]
MIPWNTSYQVPWVLHMPQIHKLHILQPLVNSWPAPSYSASPIPNHHILEDVANSPGLMEALPRCFTQSNTSCSLDPARTLDNYKKRCSEDWALIGIAFRRIPNKWGFSVSAHAPSPALASLSANVAANSKEYLTSSGDFGTLHRSIDDIGRGTRLIEGNDKRRRTPTPRFKRIPRIKPTSTSQEITTPPQFGNAKSVQISRGSPNAQMTRLVPTRSQQAIPKRYSD